MLPAALFVSEQPVPREITLPDGSVHTFYFRELGDPSFQRYFRAVQSNDKEAQASARIALVAEGLVSIDGIPELTLEQAAKLKPSVIKSFYDALSDVNTPKPGNVSTPRAKTGSGTS